MQKLIALFVLFCFTTNVFAASGTIQELERAVDDFQYALTVEWDQKDVKFQEAQTAALFQKLSGLMAQGLEKEQVLKLAENKMKNKEALEALKLKLSLLSDVKSSNDLAKVLSQNSKEFYAKGASWNGSANVLPVLAGIAVVAVLGYVIWFHATHECVAWGDRYECNTDTYYDDFGSYTDTSCGYVSYCTQYVKK